MMIRAFVAVSLLISQGALAFEASTAEVDAFVQADQDRDGLLTRAEFKVFVRAMAAAGQPTARNIRLFGAYGYAFRIVDQNNDGFASPEEMRAADDDFQAGTQ